MVVPDSDAHALRLGKLIANIQSLETLARIVVAHIEGIENQDIWKLPVGTRVPATALTNYDALRGVLRAYNGHAKPEDRVDASTILGLRDALAHGRVAGETPTSALGLVKFGPRHDDGMVEVVFSAEMTPDWFDSHIRLVRREIDAVVRTCRQLGITP